MRDLLFAALAASLAAGCNGTSATCVPGATQACACPTGGRGAQTCVDDGTAFGACDCGDVDGGRVDAGPGVGFDGGPGLDAGPVVAIDAGPVATDASLPTEDSGPVVPFDGGPRRDAGAGTDGGPVVPLDGAAGFDGGFLPDAGVGIDVGPMGVPDAGACPSLIEPTPPGPGCDSATLTCLQQPSCDTACFNACLAADSDPNNCSGCLVSAVFACGSQAGCDQEYGCLDACTTALCTGAGPCVGSGGPCEAEYVAFNDCASAAVSPAFCATNYTLLCFP